VVAAQLPLSALPPIRLACKSWSKTVPLLCPSSPKDFRSVVVEMRRSRSLRRALQAEAVCLSPICDHPVVPPPNRREADADTVEEADIALCGCSSPNMWELRVGMAIERGDVAALKTIRDVVGGNVFTAFRPARKRLRGMKVAIYYVIARLASCARRHPERFAEVLSAALPLVGGSVFGCGGGGARDDLLDIVVQQSSGAPPREQSAADVLFDRDLLPGEPGGEADNFGNKGMMALFVNHLLSTTRSDLLAGVGGSMEIVRRRVVADKGSVDGTRAFVSVLARAVDVNERAVNPASAWLRDYGSLVALNDVEACKEARMIVPHAVIVMLKRAIRECDAPVVESGTRLLQDVIAEGCARVLLPELVMTVNLAHRGSEIARVWATLHIVTGTCCSPSSYDPCSLLSYFDAAPIVESFRTSGTTAAGAETATEWVRGWAGQTVTRAAADAGCANANALRRLGQCPTFRNLVSREVLVEAVRSSWRSTYDSNIMAALAAFGCGADHLVQANDGKLPDQGDLRFCTMMEPNMALVVQNQYGGVQGRVPTK
jgi:hypothetical protein